MNDRITVIKIGGNEVGDRAWIAQLAAGVARVEGSLILVHGGGKEVSELQRLLGAEPEWRDGLRVTTPAAIRAVSMVLSGVVNKRLVAALLDAGIDALGISGEDGALLRALPARGGALGRTGEIVEIRTGLLRTLLDAGLTPVVSPVSRGSNGGALNVNADDAAAAIAVALGAAELLLVSNVPGVWKEERVLGEIAVTEVEALIEAGVAYDGMAPKLRAAACVASAGRGVRIGGLKMLGDPIAGTRIVLASPAPHALTPRPPLPERERGRTAQLPSRSPLPPWERGGAQRRGEGAGPDWYLSYLFPG